MHLTKCWGPGHRHDHAYRGNINSGVIEKIGGTTEYRRIVLVEAKHDAKMDGDSVTVQVHDQLAIILHAIMRLVCGLKTVLRDRLETQKERLTPASRSQFHELFIANGI